MCDEVDFGKSVFLSTPSGWRATRPLSVSFRYRGRISIHALRVEGDLPRPRRSRWVNFVFLSTPSGWRATGVEQSDAGGGDRISIHALRVEGDTIPTEAEVKALLISIHALRVEGDPLMQSRWSKMLNFYPRPPGGGRLEHPRGSGSREKEFLSTPSGWRATEEIKAWLAGFNISIHALRVEGDGFWRDVRKAVEKRFLSTPSGWRATSCASGFAASARIFLSTPSGWRATAGGEFPTLPAGISIHALRVEGDVR